MRRLKIALVLGCALTAFSTGVSAQQSLSVSLFERYLDSLREQSGIPGLSVVLTQGGRVVWERGFGLADVEASIPARPDTPYPILDVSQALASTLLLQQCVDSGWLSVDDPVRQWLPEYPDDATTIAQLLTHTSPEGSYRYDPQRFAVLDGVIGQCSDASYAPLLAREFFDRLSMIGSVPGIDLGNQAAESRSLFDAGALGRYDAILQQLAVPYRVDDRGRPVRSLFNAAPLTASSGLVSTARDLAAFDAALRDGILLTPETLSRAWNTGATPAGLGWFVQRVGSDTVVWHYGVAQDAYSSLIIKVPGRDLTLVLLANSDRLSTTSPLAAGDITASLFARLFFLIFLV